MRGGPPVDESRVRPRLLLAEDNRLVARQLKSLLEASFDIVGLVQDAEALVEQVETLNPDAIVTDISMPKQGGLASVRSILATRPHLPVVFVTIHDSAPMIETALAAGALGYVVKSDCSEELELAVHAALARREYLSSSARAALDHRKGA